MRIAIHGLILAAINLVAVFVGSAWDKWTHQLHPFAAQLPVGALLSMVGFALFYQLIQAFSNGRSSLQSRYEWQYTYASALFFGPLLFVICNIIAPVRFFSLGRLFTIVVFQGLVNPFSLYLAFATRNSDFSGHIRRALQRPWVSRIAAVFVGIVISSILVLVIEGGFYVVNNLGPAKPVKVYEGQYLHKDKFFMADELLGISLIPNTNVKSILSIDDQPIWDVTYGTDEFGRRRTVSTLPNIRSQFALFFGGSFTFGEGSNDNQTIPSVFESVSDRFRAYNYGVPGYGTQQMLAKLQSSSVKYEVNEKSGVLFYIYLEDVHEGRVIGQMNVVNGWANNFPYYKLNKEGKPEYRGTFSTGRPVLSVVYGLLGKSQLVRYLGLNLPNLDAESYLLTAKLIDESRNLFNKQFPDSEFYVVLYPKRNAHRKIVPYLEQAGIRYLDYFDLFDPDADGYNFKGDGHPTPKSNQILAQRLVSDIESTLQRPNRPQ